MKSKEKGKQKKFSFYLIYTVYLFVLFEVAFRMFYAISYKNATIFWRPYVAIDHYAPGLSEEIDRQLSAENDTFNILLLGGSVLTDQWGNIPSALDQVLSDSLRAPFKIHNLANPARTSRDSRQNFKALKNNAYDVVVIYHGINEVRFNHCPPEVFKTDYSHVDYYAKVNRLVTNTFFHYSIMPLVYNQFRVNLLHQFFEDEYLPFHAPTRAKNASWLAYGLNVKTAPVFFENYSKMVRQALQKNQQVITPKFLYYIPENYSLESFENKRLDYNRHRNPVELWGSVETVSAGINAHNAEIKKLAKQFDGNTNYQYVEFEENIPMGKTNYDDLCHLTDAGSKLYAEALWPALKQAYSNMQKLGNED